MTSLVTVILPFMDGNEYPFGLHIGQLEALQETTKVGPAKLWIIFAAGEWMARWPREVVKQGFIGEGMDPVKAEALVRNHCDDHPYLEWMHIPNRILDAAMTRPKTAKKNDTEEERANGETTISSILPSTMATVQ